jgi:hypothetical protein
MSNIRQEIINRIYENSHMAITGDVLQKVLLDMFDRDVFLTEDEYNALVQSGQIDEDKIYHIYEE